MDHVMASRDMGFRKRQSSEWVHRFRTGMTDHVNAPHRDHETGSF